MRLRFGGLWRHPDFVRLWAGETVSIFGTLIGGIALGFTAVVYLHASAFQVALVAASNTAAGICVGLFAGVWVDRLRRRPIMIAADIGRAAVLGSIPLAAVFGALRVEQLYLVGFLTGAMTAFFDVAYQSYLPTLVEPEELVEGNSKLTASASVAEFGAFGISGWLVQLLTGPGAIVVDALSFLVSAIAVRQIRTAEPSPAPLDERTGMRAEIVEGIRAVARDPLLRGLAGSAISLQLASGMIGAVYLLFASRELGFSPGVLGMVFAVGGVTSLFGALFAARLARRFGEGGAMMFGLLIAGGGAFTTAAAHGATLLSLALLISAQIITDPAWTVYEINAISLRQSTAPERLLGRVNAAVRFAGLLAMLAGGLIAGIVASTAGARLVLVMGGCIISAGSLWILFSPARSMRHGEVAPDAAISG